MSGNTQRPGGYAPPNGGGQLGAPGLQRAMGNVMGQYNQQRQAGPPPGMGGPPQNMGAPPQGMQVPQGMQAPPAGQMQSLPAAQPQYGRGVNPMQMQAQMAQANALRRR